MNARLSPHILASAGQLPVASQSAALCYRMTGDQPEVLLITKRRSRRWIIPKGWLMDGLSPSESAAQEAWEEAGVRGSCAANRLGQFSYIKQRAGKGARMCLVDVYPLRVDRIASEFPECGQRSRKWCLPVKAALSVSEPDLAALLMRFDPHPNPMATGKT